jgi:hypothetical protein
MAAKSEKFLHVSGPVAIALAGHINATTATSADVLCRSGIPYPTAIAISKMSAAGVGNVEQLRQCGFSASDATEIAAQITAKGAH